MSQLLSGKYLLDEKLVNVLLVIKPGFSFIKLSACVKML
jgi:hypothetical protein